MKHLYFIVGLTLLFVGCKSSSNQVAEAPEAKVAPANPTDYAATITADELKEKLYVYASDEFEGRDTGTPGHKKAVEFLKDHYVNINVETPLGGDDYFQEVPLEKYSAPNMTLTVNGQSFKAKDDFVSILSSDDGTINVNEIIDLGYGIDHENYSDYDGIDVKGKVIYIREGEPKNDDGTYVVSGEVSHGGHALMNVSTNDRNSH